MNMKKMCASIDIQIEFSCLITHDKWSIMSLLSSDLQVFFFKNVSLHYFFQCVTDFEEEKHIDRNAHAFGEHIERQT